MEKALVTGGAGFIGSNIVHELVSRDVEVVVLDDLYLGEKRNLEGVEDDVNFIEGTVTDKDKVEKAVEGCDTVFHQAARSSSPMHKEDPSMGARVNVEGFVRTAEAAEKEGVEKMVFASTSSMYGTVEPPHREDSGEEPINLYSASKMSRELYSEAMSRSFNLETVGTRYFSVYGPREKAKGKYANIISQFIWKMMNDERPVIFGDGTQKRDFTFVKDVARANVLAAETDGIDGEFFNIGTGRSVSFNTVVEKINEELGKNIEPSYTDNPIENYVEETHADISKAEEKLGYRPENSFEEGLKKTVEFYS